MSGHSSELDVTGLERSCSPAKNDWFHQSTAATGVELLEARFQSFAYSRHRHDTYAIGVTEAGVQTFHYRGAERVCLPGQIAVLHPDELHDGYAGTDAGFGYRLVYIEPSLIFDAVRSIAGRARHLPFVRDPVVSDAAFASSIRAAFDTDGDPLGLDDAIVRIAGALIGADGTGPPIAAPKSLDTTALTRARELLDAERSRVVRSHEIESVSGLTRFELARQFRAMFGTSPYRYSLMRRLDFARERIRQRVSPAESALDAGFADQAHLTRMFARAYGITPARYARLAE